VQERRNGRHAENGYSTRVHDRTGRHADGGGGEREERRQGGRRGNISSIRVSVVIPALNEARNLRHVLTNLPDNLLEVVLVPGHSTDATEEVARALRPDIRVIHQTRAGKGNALACGFAACRGDITVTLDADGSADPKEIPAFIGALVAGADFAKGTRAIQGGGSHDMTLLRRTGNRGLTHLANVLHGTHYSDLCYGYNAFWRHCLPHIHVTCSGFEVETLINVRVARARLSVAEIPSIEYERLFGESNLNAVRDGLRVMRTIVTERLRRHRTPSNPDAWRPLFSELAPALEVE
jgi:glycosyltransferase involved in cell wall biosynthesis